MIMPKICPIKQKSMFRYLKREHNINIRVYKVNALAQLANNKSPFSDVWAGFAIWQALTKT